jgi:hypothetical protein
VAKTAKDVQIGRRHRRPLRPRGRLGERLGEEGDAKVTRELAALTERYGRDTAFAREPATGNYDVHAATLL